MLVAGSVLGLLMLVEFAAFPMETVPAYTEIPAAHRWLDTRPKPFVVAEVPVVGRGRERRQSEFMLHSLAHMQRTVHGYSGIRPKKHDDLYRQLRTFPDDQSLAALAEFGVTYVVVHSGHYAKQDWARAERELARRSSRLRLVHESGPDRVYQLVPRP
jgi:sugar phosphate isomerase/epimerase